ncbi:MAG: lysophospholipid acyltransferase family protein, partial [Ginsengibacter sp.]
YINVMTVIFEFFYMERLTKDDLFKQINVTNPDIIKEKLSKGKGLILIGAHFGNWEWLALGGSIVCREQFFVIVKEQSNKKVDDAITKIRESRGNKMIEMKNSLREILKLLHQNQVIGILGDQSAPREASVKVDFFVKNVPAFGGAAGFAIKTGCPVLFGVMIRKKDGTYCITWDEVETGKYKEYSDENIRLLTQDHVNLLKEAIIKHPDHWLWFHRRFKHVI